MRFCILAFLLAVFCLAGQAWAFSEQISIQLQPTGSAGISHSVLLDKESTIAISPLSSDVQNVQVTANDAPIPFEHEQNQITVGNLQAFSQITVSYESAALTDKNGLDWTLWLSNLPANLNELRVILPANAQITGFEPVASISFEDPFLIIVWKSENQPISETRLQYSFSQKPQNTTDFGLLLGLGITGLLITALLFFRTRVQPQKAPANTEPFAKTMPKAGLFSDGQLEVLKTLSQKEKNILEAVAKDDGITQKMLLMRIGLSKATLSRTLKNLEQKQLVRLVQDGYSNRVFLTDWFGKK